METQLANISTKTAHPWLTLMLTPCFGIRLSTPKMNVSIATGGVDPIGMFAAAKDAITKGDGRGASTITQQLAKNLFRVRTEYSTGLLGQNPWHSYAHHENQRMDYRH